MASAKAPAKRGRGRPRVHDREQVMAVVCELLASGKAHTMRDAAKKAGVTAGTVCEYAALPEYAERYARAREAQAENVAARAVSRAQGATPESVNADRLAVDTDKWLASKLWPRTFGDRTQVDFGDLSQKTDEELERIAARARPDLRLVKTA